MIFVSGIHGVGKSYFCKMITEKLGIVAYTASDLIAQEKAVCFANNKLNSDIEVNQQYLIQAIEKLRNSGKQFVLDGHFCLLNSAGEVARVPRNTFTALKPETIILLMERPSVIAARRKKRDGIIVSEKEMHNFQTEEYAYAKEIAAEIGANLFVSYGKEDIGKTLEFIMSL